MMASDSIPNAGDSTACDACWRRIGAEGDRSCPQLRDAIHCRNCSVFSAAGQALFERAIPPAYLDHCTRQVAQVARAADGESLSLLLFRVGPERLAMETKLILEVVEQRPIHRIPHRTNQLLLGLVNIRGELHLCISLEELLGIDAADPNSEPGPVKARRCHSRLLVTKCDDACWVFPVDEVRGVRRVQASELNSLPHTIQKSPRYFAQAIVADVQGHIGVLSAQRVFQALESVVK